MPRAPVEQGAGLGSQWEAVATGNQLEGVAPAGCPSAPAEVWPFQGPGLPVPSQAGLQPEGRKRVTTPKP